jgi:hypothetical protein
MQIKNGSSKKGSSQLMLKAQREEFYNSIIQYSRTPTLHGHS